jgi:hypothetical protein
MWVYQYTAIALGVGARVDLHTGFTGGSGRGDHNTAQYTIETSSQLVDLIICNKIVCSLILHGSQGKYMIY